MPYVHTIANTGKQKVKKEERGRERESKRDFFQHHGQPTTQRFLMSVSIT